MAAFTSSRALLGSFWSPEFRGQSHVHLPHWWRLCHTIPRWVCDRPPPWVAWHPESSQHPWGGSKLLCGQLVPSMKATTDHVEGTGRKRSEFLASWAMWWWRGNSCSAAPALHMAKGTSKMALPTNLALSSISSKFNIRLSSFLSSITEGRKLRRVQMMAMLTWSIAFRTPLLCSLSLSLRSRASEVTVEAPLGTAAWKRNMEWGGRRRTLQWPEPPSPF